MAFVYSVACICNYLCMFDSKANLGINIGVEGCHWQLCGCYGTGSCHWQPCECFGTGGCHWQAYGWYSSRGYWQPLLWY